MFTVIIILSLFLYVYYGVFVVEETTTLLRKGAAVMLFVPAFLSLYA